MKSEKAESTAAGRRGFLKYVLGGSLFAWIVSVVYPLLAYLKPPEQPEVEVTSVKVGKLTDIKNDTGSIVRFGNKPVIVVRLSSGEFRAFSATCTHLDCTVQYRNDLGVIWCACHNGHYDLTGRNVAGPPPRPLVSFSVDTKDDEIVISRNA